MLLVTEEKIKGSPGSCVLSMLLNVPPLEVRSLMASPYSDDWPRMIADLVSSDVKRFHESLEIHAMLHCAMWCFANSLTSSQF